MRSYDLGEGGTWYVVTAHYPAAVIARRAWERVNRLVRRARGDEGIGVIRLSPRTGGGASVSDDLPSGAHPVVAVTLDRATAEKVERLLHDGEPWTPTDDFALAMIARRARVVAAHLGETGRVVVRRPDGRGAEFDSSGNLHEPLPPRG
jgi:hypothetical protein